MRPAVFLDRDGVIIALRADGFSVRTPDEVRLLPGVAESITALRAAGYLVIVVTNQPGPAKGLYTRDSIRGALARMHELLGAAGTCIDDVFVCMHHPDGGEGGDPTLVGPCECRKPKPGMLLEAARRHDIDLSRSYMVGDRETDVQAGQAAGCHGVLVGTPELPDLPAFMDWLRRASASK